MRILVAGPARSGTSWVTATLGRTAGTGFLLEPDNAGQYPFAMRATRGLGGMPIVGPDEPGPRDLRRLWDAAFGAPVRYVRGQHRLAMWLYTRAGPDERFAANRYEDPSVSLRLRLAGALAVPRNLSARPSHRVVKSIRVYFMLEWIRANWQPSVLVCRRHPLDVVASRIQLRRGTLYAGVAAPVREEALGRYGVEYPAADQTVARAAWAVGLQMSVLDDALAAHPEFHVIDHEALCADPVGRFRALAGELGLEWTGENEAMVAMSNRPGEGYELNRVAADVPGSWRRRLSVDDARTAARAISRFPVGARYDLAVEPQA